MRKLIVALGIVAVAVLGVNAATATPDDKVTICHAAGLDGTTHYVTLTIGYNAVYGPAGHFYENGTPQAGHEQDYLGACEGDPEPTEPPPTSPPPTTPPPTEPPPTVEPPTDEWTPSWAPEPDGDTPDVTRDLPVTGNNVTVPLVAGGIALSAGALALWYARKLGMRDEE